MLLILSETKQFSLRRFVEAETIPREAMAPRVTLPLAEAHSQHLGSPGCQENWPPASRSSLQDLAGVSPFGGRLRVAR